MTLCKIFYLFKHVVSEILWRKSMYDPFHHKLQNTNIKLVKHWKKRLPPEPNSHPISNRINKINTSRCHLSVLPDSLTNILQWEGSWLPMAHKGIMRFQRFLTPSKRKKKQHVKRIASFLHVKMYFSDHFFCLLNYYWDYNK